MPLGSAPPARRRSLVTPALLVSLVAACLVVVPPPAPAAAEQGVLPATARPRTPVDRDRRPVELGMRFRVDTPGVVVGIEYYGLRGKVRPRRGTLWTGRGKRLARATFPRTPATGWRRATFATPVRVRPGRIYVVSYFAPSGRYAGDPRGFRRRTTRGHVTAPKGAGVYRYAARGGFPRDRGRQANYFVDVRFVPDRRGAAPTVAPPRSTGYPDASTTGARGTLTERAGGTITTDGTVISNAHVRGQLTIRADDVVLRNVRVDTSELYGVLVYGRNVTIEDTTIVGTPGPTLAGVSVIDGTLTARRIDVSRTEDGVRLADDSRLLDSYVHDLAGSSSSHYDGVTADGFTGWEISHNTIVNHHSQTAAVWIGDPRYDPSEGVLRDNWLEGGGYTVYAGHGTGAGLRVLDNVFSTRRYPESGRWGPVTAWRSAGNTWAGNVWADGPHAGQPVDP